MKLTRIFREGNNQTIRLPEDCRFDSESSEGNEPIENHA